MARLDEAVAPRFDEATLLRLDEPAFDEPAFEEAFLLRFDEPAFDEAFLARFGEAALCFDEVAAPRFDDFAPELRFMCRPQRPHAA